MPDIVQLGNETTDGMLWQTGATGGAAVGGRILFQGVTYTGLGLANNKPTQAQTDQSWRDFGGLLNSAIAGVRDVQVATGAAAYSGRAEYRSWRQVGAAAILLRQHPEPFPGET